MHFEGGTTITTIAVFSRSTLTDVHSSGIRIKPDTRNSSCGLMESIIIVCSRMNNVSIGTTTTLPSRLDIKGQVVLFVRSNASNKIISSASEDRFMLKMCGLCLEV